MRDQFPSSRAIFAVYGTLFGLMFPLCATVFDIVIQALPFSIRSVISVQQSNALHWIIDSAPLVLAAFASLAGRRQDLLEANMAQVISMNVQLKQEVEHRIEAEILAQTARSYAEEARGRVEDKQAESQRLADQLQRLLSAMPIGVATYDRDGEIVSRNTAFGDFLDKDKRLKSVVYECAQRIESGAPAREVFLNQLDIEKFVVLARIDLGELENDSMWVLLADVTDQKMQQRQLVHAAKMSNLGEMVTGMAHELNQPLNHIRLLASNMERLVSKPDSDPEQMKGKLRKLDRSVDRAAKIIDHMRAFGRLDIDDMQPISIVTALKGALVLFESQLKSEGVLVDVDIEDNLPLIDGIESQLEQAFLNIIANARDAISINAAGTGTIFVKCSSRLHEVVVRIRDTGAGLTKEQLVKIFDPFYTTKPVGSGTGLGGSISFGIVSSFGGKIDARNWQSGAEILMTFPRIARQLTS